MNVYSKLGGAALAVTVGLSTTMLVAGPADAAKPTRIKGSVTSESGVPLVGIKVTSVAALVFALGIAAAGAGGAITGILYPFVPGSHYQWIARLLAIVVLGGMGSLNGAVLGALLFGIAETMTSAYVSPSWATAVPYAIVFAVLLIRPQGLLGTRMREDAVMA